jgi:hypothetical protein
MSRRLAAACGLEAAAEATYRVETVYRVDDVDTV